MERFGVIYDIEVLPVIILY